MVFDVYWCGKRTPQPIHINLFKTNIDDISRSSILSDFRAIIQNPDNIIRYNNSGDIPMLDIDVKTYEYGFQTGYGEDSIDVTSIKKKDIMEIYKASKKVINSDEKGILSI